MANSDHNPNQGIGVEATSWLVDENRRYAFTAGVSANNRHAGFVPAYRDAATGRVVASRFADGRPAPIHVLEGLPMDWIVERDNTGKVRRILSSVVAGFTHGDRFFTRAEAQQSIRAMHDS